MVENNKMIIIPIGILIFAAGLLCGIRLTNWAIKHRMTQSLALKNRERQHQDGR
jgi:hypothetical protein